MADLISMPEALEHLRVDAGTDDAKVTRCINGAIRIASNYCDRKFYANDEDMAAAVAANTAGDNPAVADDAVISAMLLIVGQLYGYREDVVIGTASTVMELPGGSKMILFPYRVGLGV